MSKRKWMRGERLESIPDVMAESIVYVAGFSSSPRSIEVVKSFQYRTIEKFLNESGIFKAVPYDGVGGDRPLVHIDGQMNMFEGEQSNEADI